MADGTGGAAALAALGGSIVTAIVTLAPKWWRWRGPVKRLDPLDVRYEALRNELLEHCRQENEGLRQDLKAARRENRSLHLIVEVLSAKVGIPSPEWKRIEARVAAQVAAEEAEADGATA